MLIPHPLGARAQILSAVFLLAAAVDALATPWPVQNGKGNPTAAGESSGFRLITDAQTLPLELKELSRAVGVVKVYPFRKKKTFIQCTGTHIGGGYVVTAGHCFLGAPDCNGATVSFGTPGSADAPVTATCQHVLRTEAAGAAYGSSRQDFTLFKVDNPPPVAVDLTRASSPQRGTRLVTLGFPRLVQPRNRSVLALSTSCSISHLVGNDLFQRPRAAASVLHTCSTAPGMNGALMLDADSLRPVALHQAGSVEAIPDHQTWGISESNNVAQALERLPDLLQMNPQSLGSESARAVHQTENGAALERETEGNPSALSAQPLVHIRVGSHLVEAFPLGVNDDIRLQLGQFAAGDQPNIFIAAKTGTETTLVITDARGTEHRLQGYGYFEDTQPKPYASPVELRVETTRQAKGFTADIRITAPGGGSVEPVWAQAGGFSR